MMTINEVLTELRAGKAVRRKLGDRYYVLTDDGIIVRSIKDNTKMFSREDFSFFIDEINCDRTDFEIYDPILNDDERGYLLMLLKPLNGAYVKMEVTKQTWLNGKEMLSVSLWKKGERFCDWALLTYFDKGTRYSKMKLNKGYTLKELEL